MQARKEYSHRGQWCNRPWMYQSRSFFSSPPPPCLCYTLTPSVRSHLYVVPRRRIFSIFFFFFIIFTLARYSFYSSGITELKPNSSLARPLRRTTSRDVSCCLYALLSPSPSINVAHIHPPAHLKLSQCYSTPSRHFDTLVGPWMVCHILQRHRQFFCHIYCQKCETFIRLNFPLRSSILVVLLLFLLLLYSLAVFKGEAPTLPAEGRKQIETGKTSQFSPLLDHPSVGGARKAT